VSRTLQQGGWKGNELDRYDLALDPDTGNGFYITLRSVSMRQFIVYYPISLADDGRNPRVVAEMHVVAKNYMHMLNASRVKEAS
jgi:hypothetical protein